MVKAGNTAGTDSTPPQVPPNSAAAGQEVDSVRRQGVNVDVVVGGDIGGRLKVTCRRE
jgi:hypothetical protein